MKSFTKKFGLSALVGTILLSSFSIPISATTYQEQPEAVASTYSAQSKGAHVVSINGKLRIVKDGYRLVAVDGRIVRWPANMPDPTPQQVTAIKEERGKIGTAIKIIRRIYSKLPKPIKRYIEVHSGLGALLGFLDHWTGSIESGIYHACLSMGMPSWMAWTVTKTITMLIF